MNYGDHNSEQSTIFLLYHICQTSSNNTIGVFSVPIFKYPQTSNVQAEMTAIWSESYQLCICLEDILIFESFIWANASKISTIPRNALLHFYGWWWDWRNPSIFTRVTAKGIKKNLSVNKWEFRRDWYCIIY